MRLRNIKGAREAVEKHPLCFSHIPGEIPDWELVFGNSNPVRLEIGMGKGRFIIEMAYRHPEINFLGMEKYYSVVYKALKKLDRMKAGGTKPPENLRFICMDAGEVEQIFKANYVDRIYLNFSDPWPKERHKRRRLTSGNYLGLFKKILKKDGKIEFKTDNEALFRYSLGEFETAGWEFEYVAWDLHSDAIAMADNVMTEYEEKFSAKGNPVYKATVVSNMAKAAPVSQMVTEAQC
ncbi:MAG: tRNA (guanosine(46)-N7)-methyltransferase TrmB [Lachnospiraceae bacterium]|nr:tRNA (guanosine(46)-N7)-methyltransferase TrmB [Lachnospiraceae bacterium]